MKNLQQSTSKSNFLFNKFLSSRYKLGILPDVRLLTFEGPARSGKTVDAIQIFYRRVYNSKERYHLMAGQTLDTINRNLLYAKNVGLMITHPNITMKKEKIGSYFLEFKGADGQEKIVTLTGYSNEAKWKSVVGGTMGCVFIDEVNIANKKFIDETFARQISAENPFTIFTLNGDDPLSTCYQEKINYSKIVGKCPDSTRKIMEDFQAKNKIEKGYYYCFFPMAANPVMTPEKLARAMSIYPVGSYYYITKILGERGIQGDLLFKDYMTDKLLVDAINDSSVYRWYRHYTIGIDIGADRAHNVFTLTAWNGDYSNAKVLKVLSFELCGYKEKTILFKKFLNEIIDSRIRTENPNNPQSNPFYKLHINSGNIEAIWLDCAEQNYITDLNEEIYNDYHISVLGSYKATIKLRLDMMVVCLSTLRVQFDKDYAQLGYSSYERAKKGKEKSVLREDLNEEKNDVMDAIEYSLTPHMNDLMRGGD